MISIKVSQPAIQLAALVLEGGRAMRVWVTSEPVLQRKSAKVFVGRLLTQSHFRVQYRRSLSRPGKFASCIAWPTCNDPERGTQISSFRK
jgi:hypothetical protein